MMVYRCRPVLAGIVVHPLWVLSAWGHSKGYALPTLVVGLGPARAKGSYRPSPFSWEAYLWLSRLVHPHLHVQCHPRVVIRKDASGFLHVAVSDELARGRWAFQARPHSVLHQVPAARFVAWCIRGKPRPSAEESSEESD